MWLFIEPADVWLFRDGRPFDAGSDHRANSLFPPNPSTLYGVIRSKLLALYDVDLLAYRRRDTTQTNVAEVAEMIGYPPAKNGDGSAAESGTLRLEGPFLACREDGGIMPYFPCPADLLPTKAKKHQPRRLIRLTPQTAPVFVANWPVEKVTDLSPLQSPVEDDLDNLTGWISASALSNYLKQETVSWDDVQEDDKFFSREGRFGIGVEEGVKRPQEGMLYQVSYIRPRENVGLLVKVTGIDATTAKWGKGGLLSMGGEMRAGRYQVIDQPAGWPKNQPNSGKFNLYLATSTYFEQGWRPNDWTAFVGGANLKAAALPRYRLIGGWDVAHNRQKPMHRYVSAGSVYYFDDQGRPVADRLCDDPAMIPVGHGVYFYGSW